MIEFRKKENGCTNTDQEMIRTQFKTIFYFSKYVYVYLQVSNILVLL